MHEEGFSSNHLRKETPSVRVGRNCGNLTYFFRILTLMQVAKSVTLKVSPKINMRKFLAIREFYNTYQSIGRVYASYILENSLHDKLVNDITA